MAFYMIRDEIAIRRADARVEAIDVSHPAERMKRRALRPGEAAARRISRFPARYLICIGMPERGTPAEEQERLVKQSFERALRIAAEEGCRNVVFPAAAFGELTEAKIQIAGEVFRHFLQEREMEIFLMLPKEKKNGISEMLLGAELCGTLRGRLNGMHADSFEQYLHQLMGKKGKHPSDVCLGANMTRLYFSRLMKGQAAPTKEKALALAIGMELSLAETNELLAMAGYALSPVSQADAVVGCFIEKGVYDILKVDVVLADYGLPTLSGPKRVVTG